MRIAPLVSVLFAALAVAACGIQLAPNYDRTIVEGLAKANEETMTLFATVSTGTRPNTFARRERSYDELIGKFDALRLQATVRPNPQPPAATSFFGASTQQRVAETASAPTADILNSIMRTITMMRETDRKAGLQPVVVVNFKREFEISMQQALTYERALER